MYSWSRDYDNAFIKPDPYCSQICPLCHLLVKDAHHDQITCHIVVSLFVTNSCDDPN